MFFILAKTGYIVLTSGSSTGVLEPLFLAGHLCAGVAFVVYHLITLEKTRDMVNEKDFR
jgi:hypothetical protein